MSAVTRPLEGRVALVTGGSRNIGRAIALELAQAGAAVAVTGRTDLEAARRVAAELEAQGVGALARVGDVADEASVRGWVDDVIERFGRLDILVHNAALRRTQPFESMTLAQWREITGVILDGAFLCARHAIPHMLAAGGGRIVNIGGLAAHIGASQRAHVAAAKSGLTGFTRALAVEFAERGINANCVVPGTIDTVRGESAGRPALFHAGEDPSVLGRRGRPQEVAALVRHLCLPEAGYITGQTLHVSGGAFMP